MELHMRSLACFGVRFGLLVCSASLFCAVLCAADADAARAQTALARLPLRFEENRGQWNSAVRYGARAGGYTVQLSAAGAALTMPGAALTMPGAALTMPGGGTGRVRMALVNAN